MILIIKGTVGDEQDNEVLFILPIDKGLLANMRACVENYSPIPTDTPPGFSVADITFHGPEIGGFYYIDFRSDEDDMGWPLFAKAVGLDPEDLCQQLEDGPVWVNRPDGDKLEAPDHDGTVTFRALRLHPKGTVDLTGTADDEDGHGDTFYGPTAYTEDFTLSEEDQ